MRKTLVLLDCDGPMAEFCDGFLECVEEETGYMFGAEVVTTWEITESPFFLELAKEIGRDAKELAAAVYRRVNRIGFCSSLRPVIGAQDSVEALRGLDVDVEVITSPLMTSPTWMPERAEWLQRHLGFKKDQIHFVNAKHRVPGDFLVDDKPAHVGSWQNASYAAGWAAHGLLWGASYNRDVEDVGSRVDSWDKVVEIVATYEKNKQLPTAYST